MQILSRFLELNSKHPKSSLLPCVHKVSLQTQSPVLWIGSTPDNGQQYSCPQYDPRERSQRQHHPPSSLQCRGEWDFPHTTLYGNVFALKGKPTILLSCVWGSPRIRVLMALLSRSCLSLCSLATLGLGWPPSAPLGTSPVTHFTVGHCRRLDKRPPPPRPLCSTAAAKNQQRHNL